MGLQHVRILNFRILWRRIRRLWNRLFLGLLRPFDVFNWQGVLQEILCCFLVLVLKCLRYRTRLLMDLLWYCMVSLYALKYAIAVDDYYERVSHHHARNNTFHFRRSWLTAGPQMTTLPMDLGSSSSTIFSIFMGI